jgi:hypothetical protein
VSIFQPDQRDDQLPSQLTLMATKNPLDFIPTEPGEQLLYSRANTTFHRAFEYCLAASERAVYFYLWGLRLRPRWVRVPITDIVKIVVVPYSGGRAPVLVMAGALLSGVVGAHVLNTEWWSALAFGTFIVYLGYLAMKSLLDRTQMLIIKQNGKFIYRSPADTYSAEKQFDRKFVLELSVVLEQMGVTVENLGVASPNTPTQSATQPPTRTSQ